MKSNIKYLDGPVLTEDTQSILCVVEADLLINNFKIPYYDPNLDVGYQREPSIGRIKELAKKLLAHDADLPTLIVANIRRLDAKNHLIKGDFKYNPDIHGKLFIADGQHRLEATKLAIEMAEENEDEVNLSRLKKKPFPVLITFTGNNELVEMKTFYNINKHGKNVPINDAAMILHRSYLAGDVQTMDEIDSKGETWQITAGEVAKLLNANCSVWSNRVKSPGQKLPTPNITFAAMKNHLKPFATSPDLEGKSLQFISEVACAYWSGIEESFPHMFDSETAKNYAIQTSSATEVLNKLWDNVRVKIQNSSLPVKQLDKPEAYTEIMKQLIKSCQGENVNGDTVTSDNYWRKGKIGVAGTYTSNSAKATLLAILKGHLADISV